MKIWVVKKIVSRDLNKELKEFQEVYEKLKVVREAFGLEEKKSRFKKKPTDFNVVREAFGLDEKKSRQIKKKPKTHFQ